MDIFGTHILGITKIFTKPLFCYFIPFLLGEGVGWRVGGREDGV